MNKNIGVIFVYIASALELVTISCAGVTSNSGKRNAEQNFDSVKSHRPLNHEEKTMEETFHESDTLVRITAEYSLFFGDFEKYGAAKFRVVHKGKMYVISDWDTTGVYWNPGSLLTSPNKKFTIITASYLTENQKTSGERIKQLCLVLSIPKMEIVFDSYEVCGSEWTDSNVLVSGSKVLFDAKCL